MKPKAIHALSTGRCGTMTLAYLLDRSIHIKCYHEPTPNLSVESSMAYEKHPDAYAIYAWARAGLTHQARKFGQIYGETAPRLTFFAYEIEEFFKGDVKFIHLIRNRDDVTRSKVVRGAYNGHSWDVGRIRPLDIETKFAWSNMSVKEKNDWNWTETNRWITEFLGTVDDDRKFILPFEQMTDPDSGILPELFSFLDADAPPVSVIRSALNSKMNAGIQQKLDAYDKGEWE